MFVICRCHCFVSSQVDAETTGSQFKVAQVCTGVSGEAFAEGFSLSLGSIVLRSACSSLKRKNGAVPWISSFFVLRHHLFLHVPNLFFGRSTARSETSHVLVKLIDTRREVVTG